MMPAEILERRDPVRFVLLTKVGDMTAARVLAAKLAAEGIEVRVHSESLGPYPMTVGEMAETELWVLSDQVEAASTVLLDAEVNDVIAAGTSQRRPSGMPIEFRLLALAMGVVLFVLVALRFARVY